jgi:hypothetical protein
LKRKEKKKKEEKRKQKAKPERTRKGRGRERRRERNKRNPASARTLKSQKRKSTINNKKIKEGDDVINSLVY